MSDLHQPERASDRDGVPWPYRNRFINWLIAKPWKWHYISMYRTLRLPGRPMKYPPQGRIRAAWSALTFPHVHHANEEPEEFRTASGRLLTDEDFERLADEAEEGHPDA